MEEPIKNDRIVIPLANGFWLVAEQNPDPTYSHEIFVGVIDKNGVWHQDLAVIRNSYVIDDWCHVVWQKDKFEVLVYGDEYNEDYTHEFKIGLY